MKAYSFYFNYNNNVKISMITYKEFKNLSQNFSKMLKFSKYNARKQDEVNIIFVQSLLAVECIMMNNKKG